MKYFTESSLDKLQGKLKLEKVCEALDMESSSDVRCYVCPFCNEESFVLDGTDNCSLYYCFECGAHGDSTNLIMGVRGQSFNESVKFLSIMFNSELEEVPVLKENRGTECKDVKESIKERFKDKELSSADYLLFAKCLSAINKLSDVKE